MTQIELQIEGDEEILLTPIKKNIVGRNNLYSLVDDNQNIWMELELLDNSLEVISKNQQIVDADTVLRVKLDQLVLGIIEAEQSGTENTESSETLETNPYNPDEIKVHSKQFSIKLIYEMIENQDIDLNPEFQRHFVWNSKQKSRLIESILLRIPLPMFYFAEDEDGKISVVDGLQRLTTIKEFMDNKFSLKNLEYLKDTCEGKYYSAVNKDGKVNKKVIDPKYFRWFNMTQFSVNVIDPGSPAKVKYDIFRRINTGGKPLNNQEIRNSLSGKGLRETLLQMAGLEEFIKATNGSIKDTRMDDQEVALRFILFYRLKEVYQSISAYNGYMDSSLDQLTQDLQKSNADSLKKYVTLFSNAMKNADYLFGSKYAFRKVILRDLEPNANKQLINKALFICWSVLLADVNHHDLVNKNIRGVLLKPLATAIETNRTLLSYLTIGTNGKANLIYTFQESEKIFMENVKL